jgi:ribosomal protein S12 methylthiotransferase
MKKMKVGFVSLGCSKNLIDTEMMIGVFKNNGFTIVNNPQTADIIVINTCGFIEPAKEEAINTILEMAEYKKTGKCKILVATGCLVERYKEELEKALPEVDIFLKYSDYAEEKGKSAEVFAKVLKKIAENIEVEKSELDFMDRVVTTGNNYAYLRIAEGCSNRCTYCAIPYIRGAFVSRTIEDILEEAEMLVKSGRKELILIAQDTSKYGIDIYGKPQLARLLTELCKIKDLKWIRFLYTYPEDITDELIEVVKKEDKICKYFDMPIQHISDRVLKRMNRKCTGESIRKVIEKLRKEIPNVIIRTTVMVGFPGETNEDFEELYDFIKETKFDKLGAFSYSKEDGTPASRLKEQIHPMTKKSRYNKIMKLQKEISKQNEQQLLGRELEILIEDMSFDRKYYVGRSYMDVPEIDGVAYIKNNTDKNLIGQYIKAKVVEVKDYDVICEM